MENYLHQLNYFSEDQYKITSRGESRQAPTMMISPKGLNIGKKDNVIIMIEDVSHFRTSPQVNLSEFKIQYLHLETCHGKRKAR